MNNLVILIILALFGLAILRVAWNKRIKYSYGYADIEEAEKAREFAALQQLDDREIAEVNRNMRDQKAAMNYKRKYGNRTSMPSQNSVEYRKRYRQETARNLGAISE